MTNGGIGLRLLQLQTEFANREALANVASEFKKPEWQPRSEQEIAADYEAAIRELLAQPVTG